MADGPRSFRKPADPELSFLVVTLVFFSVFGFLSFDFQLRARWMPIGSALAGVLLVIACLVSRSRQGLDTRPKEQEVPPKGWLAIGATLGTALAVASLGGFIFCVPICYLLFDFLNEGRLSWKMLLLAAAMTVFVYVFFGHFLNIPLTSGIL